MRQLVIGRQRVQRAQHHHQRLRARQRTLLQGADSGSEGADSGSEGADSRSEGVWSDAAGPAPPPAPSLIGQVIILGARTRATPRRRVERRLLNAHLICARLHRRLQATDPFASGVGGGGRSVDAVDHSLERTAHTTAPPPPGYTRVVYSRPIPTVALKTGSEGRSRRSARAGAPD
eukprot:1195828-Prorocentrum_minimum.AAC.6